MAEMDMKEKLIDIVEYYADFLDWDTKEDMVDSIMEFLATDNNVGSKWIPVKDRTPTEADGTVWVCLADVFPYNEKEPYPDAKHDRRITEAHYSQFSKRWYKSGAIFPDGVVTHWMEKAQPPKEE